MRYEITKKVSVNVPATEDVTVTRDGEADFNQIVLRVRSGAKKIDFRVVDLGDKIEVELWTGKSLDERVKVDNAARVSEQLTKWVVEHLHF